MSGQRAPRRLDRASPLPLWAQLYDDLVRRLEGASSGAAFPGEHELVQEYGVSRHTVREALRRLRESGVLESGRGRRTSVRRPRIEQPLGAVYSLFSEVEARGMRQRSDVLLRQTQRSPAVAARLEVAADTELVYLERLRYADDEPLAVDSAWLLASVAGVLLTADLTETGIYAELARTGVRVTDGEERIHAVMPTPAQRRLLRLDSGVALFAVERLGRADGRAVEWRETFVRGDRFSVLATWTPHTAYRMDVGDGTALAADATA
jgi:GntR family transcriptional regulator